MALEFLEFWEHRNGRRHYATYLCPCGSTFVARLDSVRSRNTRSCGCLQKRLHVLRFTVHGQSGRRRTSAYSRWRAMLGRCYNPQTNGYAYYGGRGISVCDRWKTFTAFYADVGEPPVGMTLDRINVNENYEPSNVRWATVTVQNQNRRQK